MCDLPDRCCGMPCAGGPEIARSVSRCAAFDTAVTGAAHPGAATPAAFSYVVPDDAFLDGTDPWVREQFETALERLQSCGARISRQNLSALYQTQTLFYGPGTMVAFEARAVIAPYLDQNDPMIDGNVIRRLEQASQLMEGNRIAIYQARYPLMAGLKAELEDRLLLMPTTPNTAPALADIETDPDAFAVEDANALRHTMIGSYLDMASITLPAGSDDTGRSTGLLISAISGSDETLLAAAQALEEVITSP